MGWKGESRRHSLSRKGIKTNIDQHKRLAVNDYVARGSLKAETIELRTFLEGYKTGSRSYEQEPFDDNHAYRRFFRLMMDGSYKGEDYYKRIQKRVEESNGNEKKLRSIAIQISMDMLEAEFSDLSRSTIQKNTVDVFGTDAEKINEQLIDDLKDFAKAHEMGWAMNKASGEMNTNATIKEWNDNQIPNSKKEWETLLNNTNYELQTGYWAYDQNRVEELKTIKFHAQNKLKGLN